MPVSKLKAWTILKAVTEGQEDGHRAIDALLGDEVAEYEAHVADLNLEIVQIITKVQNEGASLLNGTPVQERLAAIPAHEYTADDYRALVTVFEGSQYETLHLTAFFRVQNTPLLFDLVKPAA